MPEFDFKTLFSPDNAVFSGGFGLAIIAAGAQILRTGSQVGMKMMRRHFLSTLEVTSKDRSYPWVLSWLSARGSRTQHLSVVTSIQQKGKNSNEMSFEFVPGPGQHLLQYRGKFMLVQRIREQQLDFNTGKPWEKIQFTFVGRETTVFASLLTDAFELAAHREEGKTVVYTNWGSEWREFGQPRKKRQLESVVLDEGVGECLLKDVLEWSSSAEWYSERGIPYRRGYLLYGPPGSGKSSFIMALAGQLGYNICMLNLSERGLTDDRLALALSTVPPQSIVLLEDVDAAFPSREESAISADANSRSSDVTFSGLLNVLDGVSSSEERLVFMTTNYLERLDPALIRPGRVDVTQLVGDASDHQIKRLYARFYMSAGPDLCDAFVAEIRKYLPTVSMAALQGHLLLYKTDHLGAIKGVASMAASVSSGEDSSGGQYQQWYNSSTLHPHLHPAPATSNGVAKTSGAKRGNKMKRQLSVDEVDRMYFNPQEGWDKGLKEL